IEPPRLGSGNRAGGGGQPGRGDDDSASPAEEREHFRDRLLVRDRGNRRGWDPDAILRPCASLGGDGVRGRGRTAGRVRPAVHDDVAPGPDLGGDAVRLSADRRGDDLRVAVVRRRPDAAYARRREPDRRQRSLYRLARAPAAAPPGCVDGSRGMMKVTSELWLWSGGSWHFVTVPAEEADEIRAHSLLNRGGFGSGKVE